MNFVLAQLRRSASAMLVALTALLLVAPALVHAQQAGTEVQGESRDFRTTRNGRWVDLTTWQVYRSGVWISATREVGVPNGASNVFIETNHTIVATRANTEAINWNGSQSWAFLEVNDLHINTAASITTTFGSSYAVGFNYDANGNNLDRYDGDGHSRVLGVGIGGGAVGLTTQPSLGAVSTSLSQFSPVNGGVNPLPGGTLGGYPQNRIGNWDVFSAPNSSVEPSGGQVPTPRNMELRVYGKLRYYAGSAFLKTDRDANIQVTAATIGTGSTIVFRGVTRVITQPQEWSTTLATATGYFDNTQQINGAGAMTGGGVFVRGVGIPAGFDALRIQNLRGLMGRNSFWTAIFDLGRVVDRNFSVDQFTGPTDDPSTGVGTLQGSFTAGIIQVRRGTLRFEGHALLANEGAATSGSIQIMNNAILQMASGHIGRTAQPLQTFEGKFGSAAQQISPAPWGYTVDVDPDAGGPLSFVRIPQTPAGEYGVTSRMRYFVVEEGGALDFVGNVGTLSAADVRFNGTVIYSRTGDQTLVGDSPYLSFNPAGAISTDLGLSCGENGLFDPYNNNYNGNAAAIQGDPRPGTLEVYGTAPAGLGVGTAALFQPSTTAAYSHLVLRGEGTKFLIATTVTISRALIFQGHARLGLQNITGDGNVVTIANNVSNNLAAPFAVAPGVPYYLQQPTGGDLGTAVNAGLNIASRAGFFPALVYLRGTGLTGFRQENNIGTTFRGTLAANAEVDADPSSGAIPQTMWSVYGGNTDPVIFVGYTTASTRPIIYDQDMYPEGASYPIGMVLAGSLNREQIDMSPWNKPGVVHGLPAEPTYDGTTTAIGDGHGYTARAYTYLSTTRSQSLDAVRTGQVIRQTVDRVNGTGSPMSFPSVGIANILGINGGNFIRNFPVITNSIHDYAINTTATTTLQYDSESSDIMSQIEFPAGVTGPHNLVMNCASNVSQNLPIRTADYRGAEQAGINWNGGHLNFLNKTSSLFGATAGTVVLGPEYVNSTNANLPRNAISPSTGLYQASAIYNQNTIGLTNTPGVLATAYIDTRPDVAITSTKINDRYYTTGVGMRPSVTLTGTFDGRVRAGFPAQRVVGPGYGATQVAYTITGPNDFGRRGDYNNFGVVELRRGNLNIPNKDIRHTIAVGAPTVTFNYLFVLSSTAIISPDQSNVTFMGQQVGANNAAAQVVLSEATGAEQYPSFDANLPAGTATRWASAGVRSANGTTAPGVAAPIVVRGPGGPANLAGTLVGGSLSNIVFTGGTGGTIDGTFLASARNGGSTTVNASGAAGATFTNGNGPQPVHYAATDNVNTGLTELSAATGIPGLQSLSPSYTPSIAGVPTSAKLAGAFTDRYNAGPEMTSDADVTLASIVYGADAISAQTALAAGIQSGNNQVYPAGPSLTANAGNTSSSYNAGVVRANNAWNIDLPYVRNGLQHVTFLRATSNVMTLIGNLEANTNNPGTVNAGLTSFKPELSGLQVYGTIATARGDIDLNGRNIELGGNNSMLVEAFERFQYVDSVGGRPRWTAIQVGMPRGFSNGNINGIAPGQWTNGVVTAPYRTGDPLPVYPTRPSSVINNHREVRAYIGLTSGRNIQSMNENGGINNTAENPAGLGAYIYQTANPAQFRVRRWQTRGNGLNGALSTRPGVRTADRYWQVETTGTMNIVMARSEIRLQYIDTDLNNENGTTAGLPPASLNMFRAQGWPLIAANSPFIGPFQALFAQQLVGLDSYNFVKMLTITGHQQVVNGATVLNTGNFAVGDPNAGRLPDATNPQNPQAGFQIWAIGIPAPRCLVLRGQRFGGTFGDPIGNGFGVAAGQDILGFPPPFGSFATGGGISAATAGQYGTIIGPFKAGFATTSTIVADLLDEFGNVATTNFSTGASLVVGQVSNGTLGPWNTGVPSLFQGTLGFPSGRIGAISGNGGITANATTGGPVGGRFEWPNVRLDGVASTTVTFTLVNDFVGDASQLPATALPRLDAQIVAANGGTFAAPVANPTSTITYCDNQPVQISLQGGFPFSVTFATQNANNTGATNLYPGSAGPFAAPGRVANNYDGSIPTNITGTPTNGVVVGQTVTFPYATPGFSAITVIVKDRFGNFASFPTTATISIAGGQPPVDQQRTPLVGQVANSTVVWGLGNLGLETAGAPQLAQPGIARVYGAGGDGLTQPAQLATQVNPANLPTGTNLLNSRASLVSPALAPTGSGYAPFNNPQVASHLASFPNFQIWGATSSNVILVVSSTNFDPNAPIGLGAPGNTSATIHIVPGAAIGIAPVWIPDVYNQNRLDRMPSRMYIGRSNASDPRTWFYVQAVDQFGNRVDNGPNAYNGGNASITFRTPQQGLPGNAAGTFQFTVATPVDPYVKANNQAYAATGTTAPAVFGLYTFNNFTPTGPASIDPLGKDVVLTFEDPALPGVRAPLASGATGLFRPIPPVTTATTTFLPVPRVSFSVPDAGQAGAPANGAAKVGTNVLVLSERARTYISGNNTLESGSLRVSRDPAQVANDIAVGYTLNYYDANAAFDLTTFRVTNRANLKELPNVGTTVVQLPAPLPAGVVATPAFPAPTPVAINGLQGDLSPNTTPAGRPQATVNVTNPGVPGTFFLDAQVSQQLVNFTARYSDQVWARNPGIQGLRAVEATLLPPDAQNATIYDVETAGGVNFGYVALLDPPAVPPVITNAIQDKQLLRPTGMTATEDRIELESPQWRPDNVPGFVFYDDNYNPMTYTATSSDPTVVSVRVRERDNTVPNGDTDPRPTLYYAVQPGATAGANVTITVVASDGTTQSDGQRRLATDQFIVSVRNSITSVAVDPAAMGFSVSPNPVVERFTVQAQAAKAGTVRVNVVNMLGQVVRTATLQVNAGEAYSTEFNLDTLPTGAYTVQINDGVSSSARKIVKN